MSTRAIATWTDYEAALHQLGQYDRAVMHAQRAGLANFSPRQRAIVESIRRQEVELARAITEYVDDLDAQPAPLTPTLAEPLSRREVIALAPLLLACMLSAALTVVGLVGIVRGLWAGVAWIVEALR